MCMCGNYKDILYFFLQTIANMLKYEYGWIQTIAELVLEAVGEHLFINLTVADLLWGYEDVLLKDIEKLLNSLHINVTLDDRFGLFYNVRKLN